MLILEHWLSRWQHLFWISRRGKYIVMLTKYKAWRSRKGSGSNREQPHNNPTQSRAAMVRRSVFLNCTVTEKRITRKSWIRVWEWLYQDCFNSSSQYCYTQARNQLGTPGWAKSFLRGVQIFWTMSNTFEVCPTHFSRGSEAPLGLRAWS